MKTLKVVSSFIFLVLFFGLIFIYGKPPSLSDIKYVKIAGQNIEVDLATTAPEQEQGLSGRTELGPNEGMLFVFSAQGGSASGGDRRPAFWMKDMKFSI